MTERYNGFIISPYKVSPRLCQVATEGKGGKIPNVLTGTFTSYLVAKQEIDKYLNSKVKSDAKTTVEGGGQ
jgi:hypothetical protein